MNVLKSDKDFLLKLLEKVFKSSIKKIEIEDLKEFKTETEYNFSAINTKVYYKDGRTEQLYLKMIKAGKIKESIFYYWSLLYEEYLKNNRQDNTIQKAIITQVTSNESSSCILLTLNAQLNYYAEINLIELQKFFEKNNQYERRLSSLGIKEDEILFIGKKMY